MKNRGPNHTVCGKRFSAHGIRLPMRCALWLKLVGAGDDRRKMNFEKLNIDPVYCHMSVGVINSTRYKSKMQRKHRKVDLQRPSISILFTAILCAHKNSIELKCICPISILSIYGKWIFFSNEINRCLSTFELISFQSYNGNVQPFVCVLCDLKS